MIFRRDLNGLRAIAVLAVLLFHFNPNWLSGGFAGVDVFFVISGFLMTAIIFQGLENDDFNLFKFYAARANRIIPALCALCVFLLICLFFLLNPIDYRTLSTHVLGSVSFISNIQYWREAGYFDAASKEKWLLHTWSLSVEWQFYIIYPLVIILLKKFFTLNVVKIMMVVGATIGLAFSVYASYRWPGPSYYLLPMRAWEMMVGGIAFLYPVKMRQSDHKYLLWSGLGLIFMSYIFITNENIWPGYLALFPVFGTYLVIQANIQNSLWTSNFFFQKIGAWSYSIYLWHWPLVVGIFYFSLPRVFVYVGLPLSILVGYLSFRYIERFNFNKLVFNLFDLLKSRPSQLATVTIFLGILGVLVSNHEIKNNPDTSVAFSVGHNYLDGDNIVYAESQKLIYFNGATQSDIDYIAIGDSNLAHYSYGISATPGVKVILSWAGSCLAFIDYTTKPYAAFMDDSWLDYCKNNYKNIYLDKTKPIILAEDWSPTSLVCLNKPCELSGSVGNYSDIIDEQISKLAVLAALDKRVIFIIGQVPAPRNSMIRCMKKFDIKDCATESDESDESLNRRIEINKHLKSIARNHENLHFIDPFKAVCDSQFVCNTIIHGKNLFYDAGHLSQYGSKIIWQYIYQEIKEYD